MTADEFHIWLNGYLTLSDETNISRTQIVIIVNHANLVKAVEKASPPWLENFLVSLNEFDKVSNYPIEKEVLINMFHSVKHVSSLV
jgi:hypothetical protein